MSKPRFGTFNIGRLKTDLRYYGFLEQVKYFDSGERELLHHCVWFDKAKHTGLVITRKILDCDKNSFNSVKDSSMDTSIRNVLQDQESFIEKVFNDYAKKYSEIYSVKEPDTLKSVLENENTLVSIVYSPNQYNSIKVDYALGLFYPGESIYLNNKIKMNEIEIEKIIDTIVL